MYKFVGGCTENAEYVTITEAHIKKRQVIIQTSQKYTNYSVSRNCE